MSIKVIGTGFGRTGTDDARSADDPRLRPVSSHVRSHRQLRSEAAVARAGERCGARLSALFAGYASCMDWPSAHYWRDLIKVYPDARVILTWRSPESWWQSFEKTIAAAISHSQDQESLGIALVSKQVFGGKAHDRSRAIAVYEANIAAVLATVPPEPAAGPQTGRRLGGPCAHLGVPVPDQPYPNRNNTGEFQAAMNRQR